jgi:[ribosomal protein S5]-alanine N-acetyltransferase
MSFIETPRLLLRTWMPGDAAAVEATFADPGVMRFIGTGGPWSAEQTRANIAIMTERYERDGAGIWPVVLKETGTIVGECGLQPLPNSDDVEIAFLFGKDSWGKGLAFEAASAVLEWGFREHGLRRIVAVVYPANTRSIALINRLGMRYERIVRAYRADLMKYVKDA